MEKEKESIVTNYEKQLQSMKNDFSEREAQSATIGGLRERISFFQSSLQNNNQQINDLNKKLTHIEVMLMPILSKAQMEADRYE